MKTERTEAGDQVIIPDPATKRRVPRRAKAGGGSLESTPLGRQETAEQGELFQSQPSRKDSQ